MTKLLSRPPVVEPAMTIDDVIALIKKVLNYEHADANDSLYLAKGCVITLIKQEKVNAFALHHTDRDCSEMELYIRIVPDGDVTHKRFVYR